MVQNVGLPLWKMLVYACQIAMHKDFSLFNIEFNVKTVLLLVALQLQMPSTDISI